VTDYESFTGRTEAVSTVALHARVSGYLLQTPFREGSEVKKGDLLFVLDARPYQAKVEQAEAALALAEGRVRRAEVESKRAKALFDRKAISQEDFDRTANARAEGEAESRVAKAALTAAKLTLDFAHVRAPLDGRIGRRLVDPGNLVRADETVLATLVSLDPIYVYFDMDERTFLRLRGAKLKRPQDGPLVLMGLPGEEGYPHRGTIDFVNNVVNPTTGTVTMRAVLPNPMSPRRGPLLAPGLSVRVRLPVGVPYKALLVPDEAVLSDQGERFVYVVNAKEVVERRPVRVGSLHGDWRVVKGGLQVEDRVVTGGLQRLRPGMAVRPKQGPATPPNP
jgi:multidrug efflux system membrane fusion protein